MLEGVGVSAYLGIAASIMDGDYLTDAGSIPTVESRHSSYTRPAQKQVPFPQPFDNPLTLKDVYTLAAIFNVSCPLTNAAIPVKAFPSLILNTDGPIASGDNIQLLTPSYRLEGIDGEAKMYAAFITVFGPIFADVVPCEADYEVVVPEGINGQSYAVLTGCTGEITDDTVGAGPAIVEITNPYLSTV
ncbi:hypothetical protein B0J14DRAFT_304944 [Halenospora varia]|nr:hypothetical protein B0J14DRAFT_304944 [Halenospora varia]